MPVSPLPTSALVSSDLEARTIAWRRHLHANPELSFEEHETADFVEHTLRSFGDLELEPPTPTSVVARPRGGRQGNTVALRADLDALPIVEENDVPHVSTRHGVMHACGHDGHTAMLLAAAQALLERREELLAQGIREELGEAALVEHPPVTGGEDFSAYGTAAPAAFFWVGSGNDELGTTWPHHHPRFDIDEAALRHGTAVFVRTALDVLA